MEAEGSPMEPIDCRSKSESLCLRKGAKYSLLLTCRGAGTLWSTLAEVLHCLEDSQQRCLLPETHSKNECTDYTTLAEVRGLSIPIKVGLSKHVSGKSTLCSTVNPENLRGSSLDEPGALVQ